MSTTTKIDCIDFLHLASPDGVSPTTPKIIVLCNSNAYFGGWGTWDGVGTALYDNDSTTIMSVAAGQNWYVIDGTDLIKFAGTDGTPTVITTGGSGQPPSAATLIALYRNRLVLVVDNEWFMSAQGAYETFDYSDESPAGAVSGNNSDAGNIGDIITAIAPINDDFMLMGCSDSVWIMRGDPKSGGRIDSLEKGGGIIGRFAWARDPEGRVYYLSRLDLMMVEGGGLPVSISQGRLQRFLSEQDYSSTEVRMAWDAARKGLWIFFSPPTTGTVTTHLFWDRRMDAFTTHDFPSHFGPTAVKSLVGEIAQDRQLLLGRFDGYLWTLDDGWTSDDGEAISSSARMTPLVIAEPGDWGMVAGLELVLGLVDSPDATIQVFVGDNAQDAIVSTSAAISNETQATGRVNYRARARGQVAVVRISNSALARTWAFEQGHLMVAPAGRIK